MIDRSMQNVIKKAAQPALLPVFHVGGIDIDLVNNVKYLLLLILKGLTWKCQIKNISRAISF